MKKSQEQLPLDVLVILESLGVDVCGGALYLSLIYANIFLIMGIG